MKYISVHLSVVSQVLILLSLCGFSITYSSYAQGNNDLSFNAGPQFSTLGAGVTGSVVWQKKLSISLDLNTLPLGSVNVDIDELNYDIDPSIGGGVLLVNYHPMQNSFSIGVGAMFGGYKLNGISNATGATISIGSETYPSSSIGTLTGDFEVGGPSFAFHVGWRGEGFNFGLGFFTLNKSASLVASGQLGNDPSFRSNVDEEVESILSELEVVPVIPYLRLGYQFGF